MKSALSILIASASVLAAAPAYAASDYLLKLDGVEGEASSTIEIASWSFGVCNAGTCQTVVAPRERATGQATGKRQHGVVRVQASQNTQSLRESPSKASDGKTSAPKTGWDLATGKGARTAAAGVNVATGDLDGDGAADLAYAGTIDEVSSFTLSFDKASPVLAKLCAQGTHFPKATLSGADGSFELENAIVSSCTTGQPAITENNKSSMPNRLSMNVTVPKQTQGATFGEKVNAGMETTGAMKLTITGQLKHTKTGHVTLMK